MAKRKVSFLSDLEKRVTGGEELMAVAADLKQQLATGGDETGEQRKQLKEAMRMAAKGEPWAKIRTKLEAPADEPAPQP